LSHDADARAGFLRRRPECTDAGRARAAAQSALEIRPADRLTRRRTGPCAARR
jgi:hypothetical protein